MLRSNTLVLGVRANIALLVLSLSMAAQADSRIVGEWAMSSDDCDSYRIVYEDGGDGFALINDSDEWRNLGGALWRVEGDVLYETKGEESSTTRIVRHDANSVTLIGGPAGEAGQDEVIFRRCPPR